MENNFHVKPLVIKNIEQFKDAYRADTMAELKRGIENNSQEAFLNVIANEVLEKNYLASVSYYRLQRAEKKNGRLWIWLPMAGGIMGALMRMLFDLI